MTAARTFVTVTLALLSWTTAGRAAGPPVVVLDRAVHFQTSTGGFVAAGPGDIALDFTGSSLGLTGPGNDAQRVVVDASWGEHDVLLEEPFALMIPGDPASDPDVCHVVLLLPGGSSLEIAGTFSGVQHRGLFDNLKKSTVGQAAQAAGQTVKAGAQAVGGAVVAGTQKVGGAVQAGAEKAGTAIGEVGGNILAALPESPMKSLVQAIQQLGIVPVIDCMATSDTPSDRPLFDYIDRFRTDGPDGFMGYVIKDQQDRMLAKVDVLIGPDLKRLQNGEPLPGIDQLMDESLHKLEVLCADRKITRCLYEANKPKLQLMKKVVVTVHDATQNLVLQVFQNTVAPAFMGGMVKGLAGVVDEAAGDGVASRGLVDDVKTATGWQDQMFNAGLYLQSLTKQLDLAKTALAAAWKDKKKPAALDAIVLTEAFERDANLRFALGYVRYHGHKFIDGPAEKVVMSVIGMLETAGDTGDEVVDGIAGAVPEVGAAAKSTVDAPRKGLWNILGRPALVVLIKSVAHLGWHLACNDWEQKYLSDSGPPAFDQDVTDLSNPSNKAFGGSVLTSLAGVFAQLANAGIALPEEKLTKIAEKHRPQGTMDTLHAYNEELKKFVGAWKP